jgi:hypothetical protein
MSTVSPKPVPPKVVKPLSLGAITSDSVGGSAGYARPTAGNNAAPAGSALGPGSTAPDAPAGVIPGADAYSPNLAGNPPNIGGTQTGPDFGHGATIVVPDSGDRPSGGKQGADKGTVGDSGPGLGQ